MNPPTSPPLDATPIDSWGLRAFLTLAVHEAERAVTVAELVERIRAAGFVVEGRPSKRVSDSLRSPVGRGWVIRHGRGRYGPGRLPKSTASRLRAQVRTAAAGGRS